MRVHENRFNGEPWFSNPTAEEIKAHAEEWRKNHPEPTYFIGVVVEEDGSQYFVDKYNELTDNYYLAKLFKTKEEAENTASDARVCPSIVQSLEVYGNYKIKESIKSKKRLIENLTVECPELSDVYYFAKAKHDATGAIRKNSGLPYFVHPEMVAEVVAAYDGTDAQIEAALLHDTMEDTDTTAEEIEAMYGPEVAQIVEELTNYKPDVEYYGKENYINHELVDLSDEALLVKVADCVCNYLDNPKPGQAERLVRNLQYLIEFRPELPDNVRRLLKSIPILNDVFDLDKEEFDDPYIDEEEGYQSIVASRKMPNNRITEAEDTEVYLVSRDGFYLDEDGLEVENILSAARFEYETEANEFAKKYGGEVKTLPYKDFCEKQYINPASTGCTDDGYYGGW